MGFLNPPQPPRPEVQQVKPPDPDPNLVAQREQAQLRADRESQDAFNAGSQRTLGRLMGTQGARALFTGTAAGFSRTLGSANV